jgi:PAS domain S-box-containing protein
MSLDRRKTVLLVEDERIVAKDLERTLKALGYDVTASVASATAAIHAAETRRPDLVLMDLHNNGLRDGVEAARVLRTRFELPIVFVTAFADAGTGERVSAIEPYGYLVRPIKADELRVAVEMALHKHDVESRLRDSERRLMAVLESAGEGVVVADEQGRFVVCNATAERILGIGATGARSGEWSARYGVFAEDKVTPVPARELPLVRALRGESSDQVQLFVRNARVPDGVFVSMTGRPLRDERGDLKGGVVTFSDVTEKRAAAEALRVREEMLARSQKVEAVGRVAGGIAHSAMC